MNGTNEDHPNSARALPTWIVAHAILMAASLGVGLPLGMLLPCVAGSDRSAHQWTDAPARFALRKRRPRTWREDHRNVMLLVAAVAAAGFFLALASHRFEGELHGQLGVGLFVGVALQAGLGLARFRLPSRVMWRRCHAVTAHGLIAAIAVQLSTGYAMLARAGRPFVVGVAVVHVILLLVCYVQLCRCMRRRRRDPNAFAPNSGLEAYETMEYDEGLEEEDEGVSLAATRPATTTSPSTAIARPEALEMRPIPLDLEGGASAAQPLQQQHPSQPQPATTATKGDYVVVGST